LPRGQGQLILMVDDEPAMRDALRELLELHNYRVMTAGNGEEAIKLFVQHRGAVQLVLTDMDMPVMGGPELVRSLRVVEKELKFVVLTGSLQVGNEDELAQLGVQAVLSKPCKPAALLKALYEIL